MGLLGTLQKFFSKDKNRFAQEGEQTINKDLFYKVLDTDTDPLLFFTKENGWIGANKAFFNLVPLQNIEQVRNT